MSTRKPLEETGEAIDARARVVAIAEAEIGEQDPDKYWKEVCPDLCGHPHRIAWCGGFALWCLRTAGLTNWDWYIYQGPGSPSGFLFHLLPTEDPKPGDIAYFDHMQHHAIVKEVNWPYVDTIDGNSMASPKEGVTAKTHNTAEERITFYSIEDLL